MKFAASLIATACTAAASKIAATSQIESEILWRTDRTESTYTASPADYPFFFGFPYEEGEGSEGFTCGATVVGRRFAVTAAHCFDDNEGFQVKIGNQMLNVVEVRKNNCFSGMSAGADMAILVFDQDVNVSPLEIYDSSADGNEVGKTFRLIGYGESGPFADNSNRSYGNFYTAHNVVTSTPNNTITYVMDAPNSGRALNDEGMAWEGDSGSPALIMAGGAYKVAAVNSNGDCCTYGMEDRYSRLGDVALDWLNANMVSSRVGGGAAESRDCSIYG